MLLVVGILMIVVFLIYEFVLLCVGIDFGYFVWFNIVLLIVFVGFVCFIVFNMSFILLLFFVSMYGLWLL